MPAEPLIQDILIYLAFAGHCAAFLLALARCPRAAQRTYAGAFGLVLIAFIFRWLTTRHVPLQNLYEIFIVLAMVYPLSRFCRKYLQTGLETFDMALAAIILVPVAFHFFDPQPQHLPPALQSWIFIPHVAAYMAAYILLAKAAAHAAARLFSPAPKNLQLATYEEASYRLVLFAFPLLTLGLLLGAYWGKLAWGDYWNWDPKELWSFASWLIFLAYLHFRWLFGHRKPILNSLLILSGFAAVILTLLWVNLAPLFAGLHSYA